MHRYLSLVILASIALSAAPALAESPPPSAAPPAPAPAPASTYAPPPAGYVPWAAWGPGGSRPYAPPPQTERYSVGMMATSIVFVAGGATAVLVGLGVYQSNSGSCVITDLPLGAPIPDRCPDDRSHFVGSLVMIAGGITAALGVPLLIFGAKRVRIDGQPVASRAPTLVVGPRSAALRFMF